MVVGEVEVGGDLLNEDLELLLSEINGEFDKCLLAVQILAEYLII